MNKISRVYNTPALNKKRNLYEYISGFVDGEGCFSVSFSKRSKFLVGWETKPSFSASQNEDRAEPLYLMQKIFQCGFIRRDYSDKTLKYEVRSLEELTQKIIPFFETYSLLSSKNKDFKIFKQICLKMAKGDHKKAKGLSKIVSSAFQMNPGGKRKYKQEEILGALR